MNILKEKIKCLYFKVSNRNENRFVKQMASHLERPIYHFHVRKTAGKSINFSFFSNVGSSKEVFNGLIQKRNKRLIIDDKIFVGWNNCFIREGRYSFAFSHTPYHQIELPSNVYTFTCLRDPVARVLSHYKMLRSFRKEKMMHSSIRSEIKWLGNGFDDFLDNIPKEHLLNQLFMFSKKFEIDESLDAISGLSRVIFTEDLNNGLNTIEKDTGWNLPLYHIQKSTLKTSPSNDQLSKLKEMLMPEYELINAIRENHS